MTWYLDKHSDNFTFTFVLISVYFLLPLRRCSQILAFVLCKVSKSY